MSKRENVQGKKQTRRVRGEGSVFQREDGRWVASVPLGGGKKKQEYYDTKPQAERAKRKMLNDLEQGKLLTTQDQTLGSYLEYWLGVRHSSLKLTTYSMYRRYLMDYVVPVLGHVKLRKLTGDMFQSLYTKLEDEDFSPNTVRLIHSIVKKALSDALRWKKIVFNPVKDADPPKYRKRTMTVLTLEQAKMLIESARSVRMKCLLQVALLGLRRGELLALRWGDVDLEKAELRVEQALSYVPNPDTGDCVFFVTDPKTEAGRRVVSLPQFVVDALRGYQKYQLGLRARSSNWQEKDLVFATEDGGYIEPQNVYAAFKVLLKEAGLPDIRFHDLRHSAISIWLAMGINLKVVQELVGHSDIRVTMNIYGHAFPGMHRDAMDDFDRLFKGDDDK
jgi:integrase